MCGQDEFVTAVTNRPALGNFPPVQWTEWTMTGLGRVAPAGLDNIFTAMCGSCANENAFKAAFMAYATREKNGEATFTPEELGSCMRNAAPGSPQYSILSFNSGFHGRLFGSLSATRSKPIHKLGIPAFDWPAVDWPQLRYPLEENERENRAEEQRALDEVEAAIRARKHTGQDVAAVVIEPIASEGGDVHASDAFFVALRQLCRKLDTYFIVDEVQTGGGATGELWASNHWGLGAADAPDFVTFSKKMQAAGFYHRLETRANLPYRSFSTWLGQPTATLQARTILDVMARDGLLANVRATGTVLYEGLAELSTRFPDKVANLRGRGKGTFIAFDCATPAQRDALLAALRQRGINVGGNGSRSVRLRPMLIFQPQHADIFLAALAEVLAAL